MPTRDRIKLISDDYKRKFLRRVETVVQHSRQAGLDEVSEFNWEADAWRDIFGRLRDDERLRMYVWKIFPFTSGVTWLLIQAIFQG
jgi:hypothetical protein